MERDRFFASTPKGRCADRERIGQTLGELQPPRDLAQRIGTLGVVQWLEQEKFQLHTYSPNRVNPVAFVLRELNIQAGPQVVFD